jgi:hypothetical protein
VRGTTGHTYHVTVREAVVGHKIGSGGCELEDLLAEEVAHRTGAEIEDGLALLLQP